jgi:hypothetical protein
MMVPMVVLDIPVSESEVDTYGQIQSQTRSKNIHTIFTPTRGGAAHRGMSGEVELLCYLDREGSRDPWAQMYPSKYHQHPRHSKPKEVVLEIRK